MHSVCKCIAYGMQAAMQRKKEIKKELYAIVTLGLRLTDLRCTDVLIYKQYIGGI
jgi:hypothetical protein